MTINIFHESPVRIIIALIINRSLTAEIDAKLHKKKPTKHTVWCGGVVAAAVAIYCLFVNNATQNKTQKVHDLLSSKRTFSMPNNTSTQITLS